MRQPFAPRLAQAPPSGTACAPAINVGGVTINHFYRPDDRSGTSSELMRLLGCTALCNGPPHSIIDDNVGRTSPCAPGDTNTQCIAKLTQANTGASCGGFVLSYAGRSALTVASPPAALLVAGVSPSDTNIRNFTYPLSRYLYVNYNETKLNRTTVSVPSATNGTCKEKQFLCENVLGPTTSGCSGCAFTDRTLTFEGNLPTYDFISCSTTVTPFGCSTAGLVCP